MSRDNFDKWFDFIRLIIAVLLLICVFMTNLRMKGLKKENESLKKHIEYQKSVIMDLEEYLKGDNVK